MKNIGILTLPLWNNYGGILQAYALKQVIDRNGYNTILIDYQKKPQRNLDKLIIFVKNQVKHKIYRNHNMNLSQTDEFRKYLSSQTRYFVENEMTPIITNVCTKEQLVALNETLDGVVVGSDQVWRPDYAPDWGHYFLNFLNPEKIKISYAASFGKDNIELSQDKLEVARCQLSKFDGISVRETSGIGIVKDEFGYNSNLVLDPTLLLKKEDYIQLVEKYKEPQSAGDLFTYILDHNKLTSEVSSLVSKKLNIKKFEVNSKVPKVGIKKHEFESHVYPSVTKWLKAFDDANYVIADSFHGCVFSIIFNKPFIAVGNSDRGLTRFMSLLKLFELESRLVLDINDVTDELVDYKFDWVKINSIREKLIKSSEEFLFSALGGNNE